MALDVWFEFGVVWICYRQVADCFVPVADHDDLFGAGGVGDDDLFFLRGDHFDGGHEAVGYDAHTEEHVHEREAVDERARHRVAERQADRRLPHGQQHARPAHARRCRAHLGTASVVHRQHTRQVVH